MSNNKEAIKKLVTENTSWYEDNLLSTVIYNEKFFKQITKNAVCSQREETKKIYKDFSSPVDNIIYSLIEKFYETNNNDTNDRGVPKQWLTTLLLANRNSGNILPTEYDVAVKKVDKYYENDTSAFEAMLRDGFEYWLNFRRSKQLIAELSNKETGLEELQAQTNAEIKKVKSLDSNVFRFGSAGENIIKETDSVDGQSFTSRYTFPGLNAINSSVGGIAKKEGALFAVASGGGKTVLATQFAAGFAIESASNVILITTEQPPEELIPRIISSRLNIPFNKVKDGIFKNKLNSDELEKIKKLDKALEGKLEIIDWSNRDKTIEEHLCKELDARIDEGFIPDILIFDWIGGGFATSKYKKTEDYRNAFLNTGEYFNTILKQYNLAGIAFTQADSTQSEGVHHINSKQLSIGKQLHITFSIAIGISCITNSNAKSSKIMDDKQVYKLIQTWNPFKVRKGDPKPFKMQREFQYQRWIDVKAGLSEHIKH